MATYISHDYYERRWVETEKTRASGTVKSLLLLLLSEEKYRKSLLLSPNHLTQFSNPDGKVDIKAEHC